jgi:hypothetical protein
MPGDESPVMLRQMQPAGAGGHLHIEREVLPEAVLPIDAEAEEPAVEFLGFRFVENPQHGRGGTESHEVYSVLAPADPLARATSEACAAASRATGTRNGEQDT